MSSSSSNSARLSLLRIEEFPHLEQIFKSDLCVGGYAVTETFANTDRGYAAAGAIALANGETASTRTQTVEVVREARRTTISHASATAVSIATIPNGRI